MFRGLNNINLDAKGRLAIPTRYRESLNQRASGSLVMTINYNERCLWLMPLGEWEKLEQRLIELPSMNKQNARLKRLLLGHAVDVDMDKSSRVLITPPLRDFAGLDKHAVMIGQGNKFEIWSEQLWSARRDEWLAEDFDDKSLSIDLESLSL